MVGCIKVNTKMIRSMELESTLNLMAPLMMVAGRMVNSTVKAYSLIDSDKQERGNGKMAQE